MTTLVNAFVVQSHEIVVTRFFVANRSSSANAYLNPQWESCQSSGAQCTLDYLDPTNAAAFSAPSTDEMGSIAAHYVSLDSLF